MKKNPKKMYLQKKIQKNCGARFKKTIVDRNSNDLASSNISKETEQSKQNVQPLIGNNDIEKKEIKEIAEKKVETKETDTTKITKAEAKPPATDNIQEVYITKTGTKYHKATCSSLKKSKIPINLEKAKKEYEPCKTCKP